MVDTLLRVTSPSTFTPRMLNIGWRISQITVNAIAISAATMKSRLAVTLSRRTSPGSTGRPVGVRSVAALRIGSSGPGGVVERGVRHDVQTELLVRHARGMRRLRHQRV